MAIRGLWEVVLNSVLPHPCSEAGKARAGRVMRSLAPFERQLLMLHFVDGLTDREIAAVYQRPALAGGTARRRAAVRFRRGYYGRKPCG